MAAQAQSELTSLVISPNRELAQMFSATLPATRAFHILAELKTYPPAQTLENQRSSDASGSFGPFAASVSSSAGGTARYAFDASLGTAWLSDTGSFGTSPIPRPSCGR